MIRESLQLAQDLLSCAPLKAFIKERFIWAKLVPAVLLKSINDKKFLAEQGILVQLSPADHHDHPFFPGSLIPLHLGSGTGCIFVVLFGALPCVFG